MDKKSTIQQVIDGGYCIGCGACAALESNCITMAFDRYGMYQPQIHGEMDAEKTERARRGNRSVKCRIYTAR